MQHLFISIFSRNFILRSAGGLSNHPFTVDWFIEIPFSLKNQATLLGVIVPFLAKHSFIRMYNANLLFGG